MPGTVNFPIDWPSFCVGIIFDRKASLRGIVTAEEELTKLEEDLRRLKIEYEVYFNGSSSRPPRDTLYRVETLIKRYTSDQSMLNFGQRFKFNSMAQKYAVQSQLWKRKLAEKEEGRGQFAQQRHELEELMSCPTVRIVCSDPQREPETVEQILKAMVDANRKVGRNMEKIDPAAFQAYLCEKTKQVKASLKCDRVQFSVSIEDGRVRFRAFKV